MRLRFTTVALLTAAISGFAQDSIQADSTQNVLTELIVTTPGGIRKSRRATNTDIITSAELGRAACCNLGESFTTNPSVDVSYSDAATGARQIKLLGLAGTYVQMLTENVPAFRGAAAPYGLGYIPGPWMQSIQVSKGASSVKNGYESITGQINVEMKKPQADPSLGLNMYYDATNKLEANATGNLNLGDRWSAGILTHYEDRFTTHDGNADGFVDIPRVRQFSAMPRVAYLSPNYLFQAAVKGLDEKRQSGQLGHSTPASGHAPYLIDINTRRLEAFTKNAYIFDRDNDGNLALILSGSTHRQDAAYGHRFINLRQSELYASLMFERKWNSIHALSTGLSSMNDRYNYDYTLSLTPGATPKQLTERESVNGAYAQYTLNLDDRLIAMAGLRYDHSSLYGGAFTPRLHLRYNPSTDLSFHASAGRGMHSPRPLAELSYLLASSRSIDIADNLKRESAWNFGAGATKDLTLFDRKLSLSGEYYYTRFAHQLTVDLDTSADTDHPTAIISTPDRPSYSHSLQLEATYSPLPDLSLTAAWRLNDVKVDYGQGLVEKPLTSRQKALFTLGYTPNMGIWQFDATLAINGSGRMPTPRRAPDGTPLWSQRFKAYPTLNAQLTRNFRHWALYVGGENLTGYRQPNPIIGAADPFGPDFDATMVYGPLHGAMIYAGFRFNITKY